MHNPQSHTVINETFPSRQILYPPLHLRICIFYLSPYAAIIKIFISLFRFRESMRAYASAYRARAKYKIPLI